MAVSKLFVITIFSCTLLFCQHHELLAFTVVAYSASPAASNYIGDVAINCGSTGKSTAFDGREWIGDAGSDLMASLRLEGKSKSSSSVDKSSSADPVPYMTSRISAAPFHYKFEVSPGQKFVRLHFRPVPYYGYRDSEDFFTVKAGSFILLHNFSASLAAEASGGSFLVKEFCLNVEEDNTVLIITFSPSESSRSRKMHAFVNGIEIISMPTGLYFTKDIVKGARIVGHHDQFIVIDNSTALELIERLNTGASSILSVEDFGLFRRWNGDANYLVENKAYETIHPSQRVIYTSPYLAPPNVYQTSWKLLPNARIQGMSTFRWRIPVHIGFAYLVRLHFCDSDVRMADGEEKEFSVLMNDQIAETKVDLISWSGGVGIPVHRDYMITMKGLKGSSKSDLLIELRSTNELAIGLLSGLEIFKLSNLDNSLAAPNQELQRRKPSFWKQKNHTLMNFSKSTVITAGAIVLLVLLNTIVYNLRQRKECKEPNARKEKLKPLFSIDPSFCCFSLSEILSATHHFSDELLIGRGGFGKVYKGFITGISQVAAIKRLNANSKQGSREFWAEVQILSKFRHNHLVSLLGYCDEGSEMILVYEYMPRGTLADNLYKLARDGKESIILCWEQRLRICVGAAHGLDYLHTGTEERGVIHRDVKDSNILLDDNLVAKISDFGVSKLAKFSESKSNMNTKVKGTPAYMDPEYRMTGRLTSKVDVYAFGVVLLVVLSGSPAVEFKILEDSPCLVSRFRDCVTEGNFEAIIDPTLRGKISRRSLREFVKSIESCLHFEPKKRPTMAQVATSLEQALEHQERPMVSVAEVAEDPNQLSEDGNTDSMQFKEGRLRPIVEEGVGFSYIEKITTKSIQSLSLPSRPTEMEIKEDSSSVKKPIWGTPWKIFWGKGKAMKKTDSKDLDLYWKSFTLKVIKAATNNFDAANIIGQGGFGVVYKGYLGDGTTIAVKKLSAKSNQGNQEFLNEIAFLSSVKHPNIVKLYGSFIERNQVLLIYEFMENNSLARALFGPEGYQIQLDWPTRHKISTGAARGLAYLHEGHNLKVVHRDIKATNLLLDKNLNPKICDFGLAKLADEEETHISTRIAGTFGYMAPEYAMRGYLTDKADVYSFGIVLLELVSGRRNTSIEPKQDFYLLDWANQLEEGGNLMELIDPRLGSDYNKEQVMRTLRIGLLCTSPNLTDRPSMSSVVSLLEGHGVVEIRNPKAVEMTKEQQVTNSRDSRAELSMVMPLADSSAYKDRRSLPSCSKY